MQLLLDDYFNPTLNSSIESRSGDSAALLGEGWHAAFLANPEGAIQVARREIPIRAVQAKSVRWRSAVDRAYEERYATPWELKYVRDLQSETCRATTTELVPL